MEEDYEIGIQEGDENLRYSCEESNKKHINILRSYEEIDLKVKIWVENVLTTVSRRIHKYDQPSLIACIIRGYETLKIDYDIDDILDKTDSRKYKKKISDLISGCSTKNSPINEIEVIIPVIIVYPSKYIDCILETFYKDRGITIDFDINLLSERIKYFTYILFESSSTLSNYEPKSLACSFVFFYLSNFVDLDSNHGKKLALKKSHFKSLITGKMKRTDINPKDFDICLRKIEIYFDNIKRRATEDQLYKLIYHERRN